MLITQQVLIFHNAREYHATSDLACDWLINPRVATHPRNKWKNRSNRKEILLKTVKTQGFMNELEALFHMRNDYKNDQEGF